VRREQTEQLLGLDQPGEFDDQALVVQVPPLGDVRHAQVLRDQERDGGDIGGRQPQADEHRVRDGDSPLGVAVPFALADVVQEDGELQDLGLAELLGDAPELLQPRVVGVAQGLEAVQQDEGMFIHRVAMVVIELDQAGDPGELRKVRGQDAKLVHLPERLGDAVGGAEDGQKET
jgi:hypothetical protein